MKMQGTILRPLAVAGTVAIAALLVACSRPAPPPIAPENQVTELQVTDLTTGQGTAASNGATVTVHYSGWLYDHSAADGKGREFDSSRKGGRPFSFVLGRGQVIAGWDSGVFGMHVGGLRRLVIPASMAYGDSGAGGVIPPGATLVFDVELLDVQPAAP